MIAIDRDLLGTGEPLPFCGRQASIPLGAVEIAARTGASILPVCLLREPDDSYLARAFAPIWIPPGRIPMRVSAGRRAISFGSWNPSCEPTPTSGTC